MITKDDNEIVFTRNFNNNGMQAFTSDGFKSRDDLTDAEVVQFYEGDAVFIKDPYINKEGKEINALKLGYVGKAAIAAAKAISNNQPSF